eukprot:2397797-Pleurochrysis_carterae.AAC.4
MGPSPAYAKPGLETSGTFIYVDPTTLESGKTQVEQLHKTAERHFNELTTNTARYSHMDTL